MRGGTWRTRSSWVIFIARFLSYGIKKTSTKVAGGLTDVKSNWRCARPPSAPLAIR